MPEATASGNMQYDQTSWSPWVTQPGALNPFGKTGAIDKHHSVYKHPQQELTGTCMGKAEKQAPKDHWLCSHQLLLLSRTGEAAAVILSALRQRAKMRNNSCSDTLSPVTNQKFVLSKLLLKQQTSDSIQRRPIHSSKALSPRYITGFHPDG